jgi:hypothetical protein
MTAEQDATPRFQPPLVSSCIALLDRLAKTLPMMFVVDALAAVAARNGPIVSTGAPECLRQAAQSVRNGQNCLLHEEGLSIERGRRSPRQAPTEDFAARDRSTGRLPEMYSDPPRAQVQSVGRNFLSWPSDLSWHPAWLVRTRDESAQR